jgi:hypothetical protein
MKRSVFPVDAGNNSETYDLGSGGWGMLKWARQKLQKKAKKCRKLQEKYIFW